MARGSACIRPCPLCCWTRWYGPSWRDAHAATDPAKPDLLATTPVDFRKGIDGLGAVCRQVLGDNPLEGAVYVFRNRSGTALKFLLYDGQGYWMMMKRLSQGRFHWWPSTPDVRVSLSARELMILLWNGDPERAQMAQDWRRVA